MPHESEQQFIAEVADNLSDQYGEDNVHTEKVLPVTDRRVDIYVETPAPEENLAIEVENDAEHIPQAIGQATQYATQLGARPVALVPAGHVEFPELFHLAAGPVDIFQYPFDRSEGGD